MATLNLQPTHRVVKKPYVVMERFTRLDLSLRPAVRMDACAEVDRTYEAGPGIVV